MRPCEGKDYGLVLDNAGLWLEHGLSFIDRDWTLQGTKKSKKGSYTPRKIVAMDEEGVLREINRPV
jgi:hypothetical protein